jgi:hypothetical protein
MLRGIQMADGWETAELPFQEAKPEPATVQ